jgi:hypothetical protein
MVNKRLRTDKWNPRVILLLGRNAMKCRFFNAAASSSFFALSLLASPAWSATYTIKSTRCGTVDLAPQPSDDPSLHLYTFKETGTLKPIGQLSTAAIPTAMAKMSYVCQGFLAKMEYPLTSGNTLLTRSSAASCIFKGQGDDFVRSRANSYGGGTSADPPQPPVKYDILHGAGRLSGIRGGGIGTGFLPLTDQPNAAETCARVRWTIRSLP